MTTQLRNEKGQFRKHIIPSKRVLTKLVTKLACPPEQPISKETCQQYKVLLPFDIEDSVRYASKYMKLYNQALSEARSLKIIGFLGDKLHKSLNSIRGSYTSARDKAFFYTNLKVNVLDSPRVRQDVYNELYLSLQAIVREYQTNWISEMNELEIFIPQIILQSPTDQQVFYDFGEFSLTFYSLKKLFLAKALTPQYNNERRYYHPHVGVSGEICFGDFQDRALILLREGRIYELLEITISVLNSYGGNPHRNIREWDKVCAFRLDPFTGERLPFEAVVLIPTIPCSSCGERVTTLQSCFQSNCDCRYMCANCLHKCSQTNCETYMCEEHLSVCESCERILCLDHFNEDITICDDCILDN